MSDRGRILRGRGWGRGRGGQGGGFRDHDVHSRGDTGHRGGRGYRGGERGRGKEIFRQAQAPELDRMIQQNEDAIQQALAANSLQSEVRGRLPQRPGYGTRGNKVLLYANYFQLSVESTDDLFRYNVEVSQEPKGRKLKQIFRLLLVSRFAQNLNSIASDYKSILISRVDLLQKEHEREYDVHYRGEYEDHSQQNARVFRVKVTFTGKVSISACLDYLSSTNASAMFHNMPEVLYFFVGWTLREPTLVSELNITDIACTTLGRDRAAGVINRLRGGSIRSKTSISDAGDA